MEKFSRPLEIIPLPFLVVFIFLFLFFSGGSTAGAEFFESGQWGNTNCPGVGAGITILGDTVDVNNDVHVSLVVKQGTDLNIGWSSFTCLLGVNEVHRVRLSRIDGSQKTTIYSQEDTKGGNDSSYMSGTVSLTEETPYGRTITYEVETWIYHRPFWVGSKVGTARSTATIDIRVYPPDKPTLSVSSYCEAQDERVKLSIASSYPPKNQYQIFRRRTYPGSENFASNPDFVVPTPGAVEDVIDGNVLPNATYEYKVQPIGYGETSTDPSLSSVISVSALDCSPAPSLVTLNNDSYIVTENTTRVLDVAGNDSPPYAYPFDIEITGLYTDGNDPVTNQPITTRGTISVVGQARSSLGNNPGENQKVRYTAPSTPGYDGFGYVAKDEGGLAGAAEVAIDVIDACTITYDTSNVPATAAPGETITLDWTSTDIGWPGLLQAGGSWGGYKSTPDTQTVTIPADAQDGDIYTYTLSGVNQIGDGCATQVEIEVVVPTSQTYDLTLVDDPYPVQYNSSASDNEFDVTWNDTIEAGIDSLWIPVNSRPSKGSASVVDVNGVPHIQYAPNNGASGSDSFTYSVLDQAGQLDTATVHININPPGNNPPSVTVTMPTDGASFTQGTNIRFRANATDTDGTVTQVEFFEDGTSMGVDTASPYTLVSQLPVGAHIIRAQATDDDGATTLSERIGITVTAPQGVNTPPNAVDDPYTMHINDTAFIDVLRNDTDADGDALTLTGVTAPGTLYMGNRVRYTAPSTPQTVTFPYTVSDGNQGGTDTALVRITVIDPNTPPPTTSCTVDSFTADDTTPNQNQSINLSWQISGAVGTATLKGAPIDPWTGFSANDNQDVDASSSTGQHTYTIEATGADGSTCSDTVTVDVQALQVGSCSIDSFSVLSQPNLTGNQVAPGGAIRISWSSTGVSGSLNIRGGATNTNQSNPSGSLITAASSNQQTHTYTITGTGASGSTCTRSADLVVVNPNMCSISFSAPATADVGESVTFSWSSIGNSDNTLTAGGSWTGNKSPANSGSQSVTMPASANTYSYSLTGTSFSGNTCNKQVTIDVSDPNTPPPVTPPTSCSSLPCARDDTAVTAQDTPVDIWVMGNDSYQLAPSQSVAPVTIATQPVGGTASVRHTTNVLGYYIGNSIVTYTPDPGFVGQDTFQYQLSDRNGTDTAQVDVTVNSAQVGDFDITLDPTVLQLPANSPTRSIVRSNISLQRFTPFAGDVSLAVSSDTFPQWMKSGLLVRWNFDDSNLTGTENASGIQLDYYAIPAGTYSLTIKGSSNTHGDRFETLVIEVGTTTPNTPPDPTFEEF